VASTFTIRAVTTEADFLVALSMLKRIFTDSADLETDEKFRRCFEDPRIARYYFLERDGACAGVSMARIHPDVPHAIYGPYAGVLPEYRGLLVSDQSVPINDAVMDELGVHTLLMEVEDPARIGQAYPDADPEKLARRCELRLRFFENWMGWTFVDDPDLLYIRPGSADPQQVQAYDLLGFHLRDPEHPRWQGIFNAGRTAVRLDVYVQWYVELMQLEYGTSGPALTPEQLSRAYPAIGHFLEQARVCAGAGKEWARLRVAE